MPKGAAGQDVFSQSPTSVTRQKHVLEVSGSGEAGTQAGRLSKQRASVQTVHVPAAESRPDGACLRSLSPHSRPSEPGGPGGTGRAAHTLHSPQVFFWIGKHANEEEKRAAAVTAQEYLKTHPSGRDPDTPIIVVKQGYEPSTFTGWFLAWDPFKWSVSGRPALTLTAFSGRPLCTPPGPGQTPRLFCSS